MFVTHLGDEDALNKLRDRIRIRFRSKAELRALAEERAVLQRRAKLKLELEARREINHIIRRRQRKRMKACCYRDCDGNLRQVRYTSNSASQAKESRCTGGKADSRRIRRRVLRTKQMTDMTVECGTKHSPGILQGKNSESPPAGKYSESPLSAFLERQSLPHPSFSGRRFVRQSLQPDMRLNVKHPVFCDLIWAPICTRSPLNATELHFVIVNLKLRNQVYHQKAWRAFHSPPFYRGRVRQCHPAFAHKYDRSEIVHPAIWGSFVAQKSVFNDSMMTCPAYIGYVLNSQEQLRVLNKSQSSIRFQHQVKVESPCQICLSGQHGCPFCFELPEGLKLNDYSYTPGDATHKCAEHALRMMHTDLTTRAALDHDRRIRHDSAEVLIKSVPCGAIIKFAILCDYTVAHLHHLFRSASVHGIDELTFFYIPTENGLIEMDIKGPTTTSIDQGFNFPDHGAIPVFRYGLNKAGACTIIFHGCCVSTSAAVGVFIRTNMLLKKFPSASIFLPHLDAITASLSRDSVQTGLQETFLVA